MEIEQWETIKSNLNYEISSYGNIRNSYTKKILKQQINKLSYKTINIKNKSYMVHRLVAIYFIPNLLNKSIIKHIDHNKWNNNYKNLEQVTHSLTKDCSIIYDH